MLGVHREVFLRFNDRKAVLIFLKNPPENQVTKNFKINHEMEKITSVFTDFYNSGVSCCLACDFVAVCET